MSIDQYKMLERGAVESMTLWRIGTALLAGLLLLGACTSKPLPAPPSRLRAEMKQVTLEVQSSRAQLGGLGEGPIAGKSAGASYGAGQGAGGSIGGGAYIGARLGCNPAWNAFIIFTCPFGLLGGLAVGTIAAVPAAAVGAAVGSNKAATEEEAKTAVQNYERVAGGIDPAERLDHFLRIKLAELAGAEILDNDEPERASAARLTFNVDTGLELKGRLDPDLLVAATVKGVVRRHGQSAPAYERSWSYSENLGRFYALTENGGAGLTSAINRVYLELAHSVAGDLYLGGAPKPGIPSGNSKAVTISAQLGPAAPPEAERGEIRQAAPAGEKAVQGRSTAPTSGPLDPIGASAPAAQAALWDGDWSGTAQNVQVAFVVKYNRIVGGRVETPTWRGSFAGEVAGDGRVEGAISLRFKTYGKNLPGRISGTLPRFQVAGYDGATTTLEVQRE